LFVRFYGYSVTYNLGIKLLVHMCVDVLLLFSKIDVRLKSTNLVISFEIIFSVAWLPLSTNPCFLHVKSTKGKLGRTILVGEVEPVCFNCLLFLHFASSQHGYFNVYFVWSFVREIAYAELVLGMGTFSFPLVWV